MRKPHTMAMLFLWSRREYGSSGSRTGELLGMCDFRGTSIVLLEADVSIVILWRIEFDTGTWMRRGDI